MLKRNPLKRQFCIAKYSDQVVLVLVDAEARELARKGK